MMNEQNGQFDNVERGLPDRLRTDLQGLFAPPGRVPPRVDKAIMDQARRRLARPRRIILRLRWAGGIAAAAAVIVIGFVLLNPQSEIRNPKSFSPDLAEGRADIDGNGRVDILDAFRLARHIEARGPARTEWDLNGDGRVDRQDVDLVAFAAVRLASDSVGCVPRTSPKQERWCVIRTLPGSPSSTRRGEGVGTSNAMYRAWETFPPLRVAGILPAIRGRDALDTEVQGQDALATNPFESPLDKGV